MINVYLLVRDPSLDAQDDKAWQDDIARLWRISEKVMHSRS